MNQVRKWVKHPEPDQPRGTGEWKTIEELGLFDEDFIEMEYLGFLPTYEGEFPPDSKKENT